MSEKIQGSKIDSQRKKISREEFAKLWQERRERLQRLFARIDELKDNLADSALDEARRTTLRSEIGIIMSEENEKLMSKYGSLVDELEKDFI